MKTRKIASGPDRIAAVSVFLVAVCIFLGAVISFRASPGSFLSFEDALQGITLGTVQFSRSIKKALFAHLVYTFSVIVFSSGFPMSFLPGIIILAKSFVLGTVAGLAARCCVMPDVLGIFFSIFISNVLILPVYVLMFISGINYSIKILEGALSPSSSCGEFFRFAFKMTVFFGILAAAECLQTATGVMILKLF